MKREFEHGKLEIFGARLDLLASLKSLRVADLLEQEVGKPFSVFSREVESNPTETLASEPNPNPTVSEVSDAE